MARVTYFPRYSNKENAVTNTVLHLFSQVYQHSTEKLQILLGELFGDVEIPLGISFEQQIRSSESVPDAVIRQSPVHVVIETKVDSGVDAGQLRRHCRTFSKEMAGNFLILLTKIEVNAEQMPEVISAARESNARFCAVSFEKLCEALKSVALPHETHLKNVVEDFCRYCDEQQLLPDRRRWLSIVPCGDTFDLNARWHLYFKPAARGYEPSDYLGIYNWKAVRFVGRIVAVYDLEVDTSSEDSLRHVRGQETREFQDRIRGMIQDTETELGWRIHPGMRFFCAHRLVPTEYRKTSPYGIQGGRYGEITPYVREGQSDEDLAEVLRGQTWA